MSRAGKMNWGFRAWLGVVSLVLVLVLGLAVEQFSMVSYAQSQGKVTASSVNIRREPSASSQAVGTAVRDAVLTINNQTTGSDGYTWYQVYVDANTIGYIRSDLVTITDGSTPSTVAPSETQEGLEAVSPVSGSVTGGRVVRVRKSASTTSDIVTTVEAGSALTVTGKANGSDGKIWYQVEFIANGAEVVGFIRSDYVDLAGELKPATEEQPPEQQQPEEQEPAVEPEVPEVTKDWDTQLQGDEWYLLNMVENGQYKIDDLFNAINQNKAAYEESQKDVKNQKIAIIILVIIIIGLGAGAAFLFLKIKDMTDSAYFSEVERDAVRRRSLDRSQSSQKVMHTVGAERKPTSGNSGSRPTGSRPAGAPSQGNRPTGGQAQGNRPTGNRPSNGQPQGTKPTGNRPSNGQPQGTRPAGAQSQNGRPAGAQPQNGRPAGAQPQNGKPAEGQSQGSRPAGTQPQNGRPTGGQPQANKAPKNEKAQDKEWKSKNFMTDEDEFEFEFLNWDGEEE